MSEHSTSDQTAAEEALGEAAALEALATGATIEDYYSEERVFEPVGSNAPQPVRARLMAAANRPLGREVEAGRFRSDLFFRLNVGLHIHPLRERREEIPKLVEVFLERFARDFSKGCLRLADETLEYLVL